MGAVIAYWLRWPAVEVFLQAYSWAWPLCEVLHFVGLSLLVGTVGMFDLRLLGVAKRVPVAALREFLPWGIFGFVLCVISGLVFVTGIGSNLIGAHPYDILMRDLWLQLKLVFIFLAGINLLIFYQSGVSRAVDSLGPGDEAPLLAKLIAGTSLFLWVGVVYWGRLVPWGV